jgi:hypothetical protein
VSLIASACHPGWAILVKNETGQKQYLRYRDGPSVLVAVDPESVGLLGIGNAPGPRTIDLVTQACQVLATVEAAREGGTLVNIRVEGGVPTVTAAATELPKELKDPRLATVPDGCLP